MSLDRRSLLLSGGLAPLIVGAPGRAAPPALQPNLKPLGRLVGKWRGEGQGQPGHSLVERSYTPDLGGQFLVARNRSTYPPQDKNPKGEVHEDLGLYGFDKARRRVVLRQFHVEQFVVQYVAVGDLSGEEMVFDSEGVENIPAGFRSRETWRFSGAAAFEEVFEIADPGKPYEIYSRTRLTRA
jgi:hypothetical protein